MSRSLPSSHLPCWLLLGLALLAGPAPAQPQPAQPPAAVPVPVPTPVQPAWVARGTAELQVLDKVTARAGVVSIRVGQTAHYGAIEIAVQACFTRPPDQAPDATAYLLITDEQRSGMRFRGWMLANNPTVAILEHPIYDVRVLGCRP